MVEHDNPEPSLRDVPLGVLLQIAGRFMAGCLEGVSKDVDLTPPQLSVLGMVCRFPGLTQTDYGATLCIGPATLGRHAVRLEKEGFVTRTQGAADSREMRLRPTEVGMDVFHRLNTELSEVRAGLTKNLPDGAYAKLAEDVTAFLKAQGWSLPKS